MVNAWQKKQKPSAKQTPTNVQQVSSNQETTKWKSTLKVAWAAKTAISTAKSAKSTMGQTTRVIFPVVKEACVMWETYNVRHISVWFFFSMKFQLFVWYERNGQKQHKYLEAQFVWRCFYYYWHSTTIHDPHLTTVYDPLSTCTCDSLYKPLCRSCYFLYFRQICFYPLPFFPSLVKT